jgi:hypothetical protein
MNETLAAFSAAVSTPLPRLRLSCDDCGRVLDCPGELLDRFAADGWPRCCGEVMSLGTDARPVPAGR